MAFDERRSLASPTGAAINVYMRASRGPAIGIVHVSHGLAEHAARYGRFAQGLTAAGFHVYAHDHRGHGYTTAPDAPLGRFAARDGVARVLDDMDAVHAHIGAAHPRLPLILFGHSMGGLVALNFVLRRSKHLAGAAIWNANFSAGILGQVALMVLAWERFRLGSDMPSRILPRMTFQDWGRKITNHRTLFDWLSRDPAEVDAYIDDPLCGWDASISMWRDIFAMVMKGADDAAFATVSRDLSLNLVGGGADPSTERGRAVEALAGRMRRMGFSNLVSTIYPQTRHEGLNDINRDEITADFIDWAVSVVTQAQDASRQPRTARDSHGQRR